MKEQINPNADLEAIRSLMERSVKFLSLSGLSGILAGIYALTGAAIAYFKIHYPVMPWRMRQLSVNDGNSVLFLLGVGMGVLISSIATGLILSYRKAKRSGQTIWNETSRRLLINLTIPLGTGGIFTLLLLYNGHYGVAAPACLVFYGLALINASSNLYEEVRYLGFCEIVLGLINASLPGYGLFFWAIGFGVLHLIYGVMMYRKYDQ